MESWEEIRKEVREIKKWVERIEEKIERAEGNKGGSVAEGSTPTEPPADAERKEKKKEKKTEKEEKEEERYERLEREKRRKNIVVKGRKVTEENWREESRRILRMAAGREVGVAREWERSDGYGGKIWIAELEKEEDKVEILRNKAEVERKERIEIDKDRTYAEREEKWRRRQKEKEMWAQGMIKRTEEGLEKREDGKSWLWKEELGVWMQKAPREEEERKEKERKEKERKRAKAEEERREIREKIESLAEKLGEREREIERLG